jgi:cyclophilin family peptidyl-prolyl cis-trans isomerase
MNSNVPALCRILNTANTHMLFLRRTLLRALLPAALSATWPPHHALAGERVLAQRVGTEQMPLGDLSIVWGGKDRCDPTDSSCAQGGQSAQQPTAAAAVPPTAAHKVTDRVAVDLSVGGEPAGTLSFGLWREAAPKSVDAFVRLAGGTYVSDPGEAPAGYARAQASRLVSGEFIEFARVLKQPGGSSQLVAGVTKPQRVPCAPPLTADPPNGLAHTTAGLLSVRRGGGRFDFEVTTGMASSLDREQIIIGALTDEESMRLLARLDTLPTNNYGGGPLAAVKLESLAVVGPQALLVLQ